MEYTYDAAPFKEAFESEFTWLSGFMRSVHKFNDKTALIDPMTDTKWSYTQLNADCNRLANALRAGGARRNDVVMHQLMNSPQFVFCYIAPQKLGAVNCAANFNLAAGETARIIDHDHPVAYIYDCDVREMVWKALSLCQYKPKMIIAVDYRGTRPTLPEGHVFYDDFVKDKSAEDPVMDFTPSLYDEVTRLLTSGTTGMSKEIPVNNVNEVLSAHDVIMHFPLCPKDITMNMTPWFHRGGLHSGGPNPTLYVGGTCVILRVFNAKTCLDYACKYGVTFLIGVPAILTNLAARQEKKPTDLSHLKGIVTMGSPLEKHACIRFQKVLTPNIFNGYGTTETFWNCFLRPYDLPEMSGTAGRACTDDEVRIVKAYDDRHAEPDELVPQDGVSTGEIIIYSMMKSSLCYLDNPELTEEKYYKGWLYTHDLGTWDRNQYISVSGRKDDMMICMGENIYPSQIEVLNQHPGVKDCIVTGIPDSSRGEAVAAYIVKEDSELTVQDLNRFCTSHSDLSTYKCPRYYSFIDEVPYNATGKKQHFIMRNRVKEDLKQGKLQRP